MNYSLKDYFFQTKFMYKGMKMIMKKIKILSVLIILIMVMNFFAPITFSISENVNNINNSETELIENIEDKSENIGEDSRNIDNDTVKEKVDERDGETQETVTQEKELQETEAYETEMSETPIVEKEEIDAQDVNKQEELNTITTSINNSIAPISNIDFSASIDVNGYEIGTYLSNGIYYLFVPKTVNITSLAINYQYGVDVKQVSSGTIDNANKTIVNNFDINDTLEIITNDNKTYTIKVMQSDIPSMCINLKNDVSLRNSSCRK